MSPKKPSPRRRPPTAKPKSPRTPTTPPAAQSPPSQRSVEAELRTLITLLAPTQARLIASVRRALRKRLPTAHELIYEYRDAIIISYSPNEHGYNGVLALRATATGVQLHFNRGKNLPDPEKLLRGSGSQIRHTPLPSASTLTHTPLARLIHQALALNPLPFPTNTKGPTLIRPTSAQKRRQARN